MSSSSRFTNWQKSRRSAPDANCVEIAFATDYTVGVRDSKNPTGPMLEFDPHAWRAFTSSLRGGQLR